LAVPQVVQSITLKRYADLDDGNPRLLELELPAPPDYWDSGAWDAGLFDNATAPAANATTSGLTALGTTASATTGITVQNTGTGTSQNIPPALVLNYIIKT
jgi:hypothetical protein